MRPKKGECYSNGFRAMMALRAVGLVDGWRLCHGVATGSGPIHGVRFGHCWLEYGEWVFDPTFKRAVPKSVYYLSGEVGPVFRYSMKKAGDLAMMAGDSGPWHPTIIAAAHAAARKGKKR